MGICGSTRKNGNSEWIVRKTLESAKTNGATTDLILLRDVTIEYCKGCDACHENGGTCVIKDDDMQSIYPKLLSADVIVFSCPNYFKNVSAMMKNFMDRTNAFVRVKPLRKLEGKGAVGLCVGGEELEDTQHCENALVRFFKAHRMKIMHLEKIKADAVGDVTKIAGLENKLMCIGKKLAMGSIDKVERRESGDAV